MKKITDPDFKYVPACSTDIRKTFERVRREQREAAKNSIVLNCQPEPMKPGDVVTMTIGTKTFAGVVPLPRKAAKA